MAETAVEDKVSVSTLKSIFDWARSLGQPTVDSESEAVERNAKANAEALRRAKMRNQDAEEEKKKKEEEDAEAEKEEKMKEKDKKAKDAEEKEKEMKKMEDSIVKRILDAFKAEKKEEEDDEEEEEGKKKEEKDSDLIPVETLSGEEVPKNPIPGADKALDHLRSIRSVIAATRDRKAIDAFNKAVKELKAGTTDAYSSLADPKKPEALENEEERLFGKRATDSQVSDDFVNVAKNYHRRNPGEAAAERRAAGKE